MGKYTEQSIRYVDLFKQSGEMIHDCGSFIMEDMLVNMPCMYLQK